ncbi:2OG-Fe(II) oxygenase [Croceimicrobium hydrocarbonivorans]|uniref:2OG-Fe(II) oxygenase n=1 Tax=Croceimicrobium hydrocarbonivorans TaxID=2761580 RepID=A0A7H0VJK4_9FLAO|nr:2OG-Fe(II) oxygenase [Croceimicrobium hydrocarbonivorans]QNR25902.1 2OG-Fe(II) oxygenase [Croceimicrobium hydrocarbonivorans]
MNYVQSSLEEIADALAEQELVILDQFLSQQEVDALLRAFDYHAQEEDFKAAGIGNTYLYTQDKSIRSDRIMWLSDNPDKDALSDFKKRIEALMADLNPLLFLSLRDVEMHLAEYTPGAFYEKHVDQFKKNGHRILSFACYLNRGWQDGDGGELRIFKEGGHFDVEPLAGRLALFRSDTVEHAVRPAKVLRRSITGWMLDRPIDFPIQD